MNYKYIIVVVMCSSGTRKKRRGFENVFVFFLTSVFSNLFCWKATFSPLGYK